jgi:hypothetical protein
LPRWSNSCPERDRTHEFCTGIVDNIDGNTLAEALARLLGASAARGLAEAAARPPERAIAAAFFSPQGLANLARHIDGLERVWLLFGVEAPRDVELWRPNLGESPEHFEARLMREGLIDRIGGPHTRLFLRTSGQAPGSASQPGAARPRQHCHWRGLDWGGVTDPGMWT